MPELANWPVNPGALIPRPRFTSGQRYGPLITGAIATQALGGGNLWAAPFYCPIQRTFDRIGVSVSTAGTAGTLIRLGIYRDGADGPDGLLLDAGTVAGDSLGDKTIAINQALTPALYWLCCVGQNVGGTLAQVRAGAPLSAAFPTFASGNLAQLAAGFLRLGGAAGALPASLAPIVVGDWDSSVGTSIPLVSLRAA